MIWATTEVNNKFPTDIRIKLKVYKKMNNNKVGKTNADEIVTRAFFNRGLGYIYTNKSVIIIDGQELHEKFLNEPDFELIGKVLK